MVSTESQISGCYLHWASVSQKLIHIHTACFTVKVAQGSDPSIPEATVPAHPLAMTGSPKALTTKGLRSSPGSLSSLSLGVPVRQGHLANEAASQGTVTIRGLVSCQAYGEWAFWA